MNIEELISLIFGGIFGLASFLIFAIMALFFFADREADKVKKLKKQENEKQSN